MTHPAENIRTVPRRSRLHRALALALFAGATAAGACMDSGPAGPESAAPDRPSLALNPACDPGLGGQTHADSVLAPETWSRTDNPHRVDEVIYIHGAGILTLQPGVQVCFGTGAALAALGGGYLVANGLDTARIVLTAVDPDSGWWGVHMAGNPTTGSSLRNVRLEHTRTVYSLSTNDFHAAVLDSVVFRQVEHGLHLWGRGTSFRRSRMDTVTSPAVPAVALGNLVTFEKNTIRGAAGVGVAVLGTSGVSLLGGRIEGSGGVGLRATAIAGPGFTATQPVRVVGGASYPAELSMGAFSRLYTQVSHQDSLLGNARDTLMVAGGALTWLGIASSKIPWRVTSNIVVTGWGGLNALPGAVLVFDQQVQLIARDGGRIVARGTKTAPVLFTGASAPSWYGILLEGAPAIGSYLTNVRIENVRDGWAVQAGDLHTLVVDSAVFRQVGAAVWLISPNSRISRTRVDTTTTGLAAIGLWGDNQVLESTRVRASGGVGIAIDESTSSITSCEVLESAGDGILVWNAPVHNCNLVGNQGSGILSMGAVISAESNWWGDAAGPNGPNGDGVQGGVYYTPWRTTPYVLPYVP
ncbi:MAG TPA: right-handed parallel beta-helix repeat-containing protein [Longimicrobium sp.]|nr:right-handed parallel beta-helix repeat-containing protein [Longimicrobium sp.]